MPAPASMCCCLPVLPRSYSCLQLEARRAEAARWRDLVDSRDALAGEREALLAQVGTGFPSHSLHGHLCLCLSVPARVPHGPHFMWSGGCSAYLWEIDSGPCLLVGVQCMLVPVPH